MAYSEKLANKIRAALADLPNVEEKKMFGGLAFMVQGKMCITVGKDRIMCRTDPDMNSALTKRDGIETVRMRGREYKGYIHINEHLLQSKIEFDYYIKLALDFNKISKSSIKNKEN